MQICCEIQKEVCFKIVSLYFNICYKDKYLEIPRETCRDIETSLLCIRKKREILLSSVNSIEITMSRDILYSSQSTDFLPYGNL